MKNGCVSVLFMSIFYISFMRNVFPFLPSYIRDTYKSGKVQGNFFISLVYVCVSQSFLVNVYRAKGINNFDTKLLAPFITILRAYAFKFH